MSSRGGIYEGPGGELLHGDGRRVASSSSDELRSIKAFSVLAEPDRDILASARRWIRHMWLEATPGSALRLDGIDHDSVFEVLKQLDDLAARTSTETMLSRDRTSEMERQHARESHDVCPTCGGLTINGTCVLNCDRY
jgi:hypothetical protein